MKEIPQVANRGYDCCPPEPADPLSSNFVTMAWYRKFRNASNNRPETTNLNHQYIIRRVLMCSVLDGVPAASWLARERAAGCDVLHI
jgi:hypothetical protein